MAHADATGTRPSRARFELVLALTLLGFGLLLLPALIYLTGMVLLGAYGGGGHLGSFYGDYFRDLAQGAPWTWVLVLGPYGLVQVGRLVFLSFGRSSADEPARPAPPPASTRRTDAPRERLEPTLKP